MLADPAPLAEILCIEDERVVARDNTIVHEGRRLQLPQSPVRAHYVKARVKVREYPDGTLAVFHGPRRIARYSAQGVEIAEIPTAHNVTPCSPPSRRGLAPYANNCLAILPRVTQQDQVPEWARTALADKNRLTTEDAKLVEDAFAQRLAELPEAAPENAAQDPLPDPSVRTSGPDSAQRDTATAAGDRIDGIDRACSQSPSRIASAPRRT